MGEIIGSVVKKLVEYSVDLLKKPVKYLCCYSCHVNQLREEVSKLEIDKNSLNEKIENARVEWGGIRVPADVEDWLAKVNNIEIESNQIWDEATQVQKTRLSKWIPFLHFSLSRKAQKTTEAAVQNRNPRFEQVAYPLNTADLEPIPTTSEILLKSRQSLEEEIIDALKLKDVYLIGVHGMGGVGKTTMVENIERKVAEKTQDSSKMFERIVKAVVSQEPDLLKIQKHIAEGLGLKLEDEDLGNRAKRLHTSLVNIQSVLIIFDDVWDRLDLEHIGIPSHSTHSGCKLLLTSRDRKVITSTAENAKIFHLNVLEDDEAWVLFRKNAGDSIDSLELHQIAKQVARECKGLPLALEVVGRALNGENKACWQDALVGLQQAMPQNVPNVLEHVYKPLLLSFNKLEIEEYRYLLLLCCLFEEDSVISLEELVRYGMGLGIFEGMDYLSEVRNRVKSILCHLISRSLLLDSSDNWGKLYVKMHDVVRDVGIHMKKQEFLISHGKQEWPKLIKDGSYGNYTCISLTLTSSEENPSFPECTECPRLELLRVVYRGHGTLKLPNDLFTSMSRSLKVLEIWKFDSLPPSTHMLNNLRSLYLVGSRLERVSVIGELMNLENLCLMRCQFVMLPKKIGELKNLKKLDVIDCWELEKIEYGVVSGLVRLEELDTIGSSLEWEAEEEGQGIKDKSSLAELNSLSHLTTLCIQISNSNAIPKEKPLWVHKVKQYSIAVSADYYSDLSRFQRGVHLGEGVSLLGDWFYDHMAMNAEYLDLCGLSCTNVISRLISAGYKDTRVLKLTSCNDVKYLIRSFLEGQQNSPIFPVLKILNIDKFDSLEEIYDGALPVGSFKELEEIRFRNLSRLTHFWTFSSAKFLKVIRIHQCEKLLYIFPLSIAESLTQLQELDVSDCPAIKEIFRREEEGLEITINKIKLPKLCILRLTYLPRLLDFAKVIDEVEVPQLCELYFTNAPNNMREGDNDVQHIYLFDGRVERNNIQPWFSLPTMKNINCFNMLDTLTIESLHNVTNIFSHSSVLSGFAKLRELYVQGCSKLENVMGEIKTNAILFPQMQHLTLKDLPELFSFCHSMGKIEFPLLKSLTISNCPKMGTFCRPFSDVSVKEIPKSEHINRSFFSKEVLFPNLYEITLSNIKSARIFGESIPIENFCGLQYLTVKNCDRMTCVFSDPNIFTSLEELILDNCGELQEVISKKDHQELPTNIKITLFPQLSCLELKGLPKMHKVFHIKDDLELPSLVTVTIQDDPILETFSSGSLHLPVFKRLYGLSDLDFASKFFFHKERSSCETQLDNYCFTISPTHLSLNTIEAADHVLIPDSSDGSFSVGVSGYFFKSMKIGGKLETGKLLEGVVYEIILIICHEIDDGHGLGKPLLSKLTLHGGVQQHNIDEIPSGKWVEIIVGEFIRESRHIGDLEFSISLSLRLDYMRPIHTKGIVIRSKGSKE